MRKNIVLAVLSLLLGLIGLFIFMSPKPPLYLMANDIVPVFLSKEDAMTLPKERAWKNLEPQQKVLVLSCIDVKHYLIYEVLIDGKVGVINEGDYKILRNGQPAIC